MDFPFPLAHSTSGPSLLGSEYFQLFAVGFLSAFPSFFEEQTSSLSRCSHPMRDPSSPGRDSPPPPLPLFVACLGLCCSLVASGQESFFCTITLFPPPPCFAISVDSPGLIVFFVITLCHFLPAFPCWELRVLTAFCSTPFCRRKFPQRVFSMLGPSHASTHRRS